MAETFVYYRCIGREAIHRCRPNLGCNMFIGLGMGTWVVMYEQHNVSKPTVIFIISNFMILVLWKSKQKLIAVNMVANIAAGDADEPLEIKLLRKWPDVESIATCIGIIDVVGVQLGAEMGDFWVLQRGFLSPCLGSVLRSEIHGFRGWNTWVWRLKYVSFGTSNGRVSDFRTLDDYLHQVSCSSSWFT